MKASTVPFEKAAKDVTGGNPKVQRRHYLNTGALPVIDQGQSDVAGYTDDAGASYRGTLPVVLFGDHTRILKYVDHPFALGADGVKALAPREGFDAKFLYYYWQSCDIPSHGYSRHFKFLKELPVSVFAPSEQRRIVEILDHADVLRKLRREADAKAARILPSLFFRMFGDPATNPMGWPMTTVGELLSSADYGTSTRASDDGRGLPLIRMSNVTAEGSLQLHNLKYVELSETEVDKFALADGDILFNRTNSLELVGKTGLWRGEMKAVLASYFIRLRVNREKADPFFLWAYMNTAHMKSVLRATARGAIGQANINTRELRAFAIYHPSSSAQKRFAEQVERLNAAIPIVGLRSRLDALFGLLLQRAFSGQLTAKWRQAHMQELLTELQQQARLLNLPVPN